MGSEMCIRDRPDLDLLTTLCTLVSRRAALYLATALHALWTLRTSAEDLEPGSAESHITIACDGTIVEKYPHFRARCQGFLDDLAERSGAVPGAVRLRMAADGSVLGAAVAAACCAE